MPNEFKGVINLDIRDSKPDWDAFLDRKAPARAPNVLVILYDDTGCAAWSPYGGRINMPKARPSCEERTDGYAVAHDSGVLRQPAAPTFERRADIYALAGEGLAVGYASGDAVTKEYQGRFPFAGGQVIKMIYDVADDVYVDRERQLAAALARDWDGGSPTPRWR